MTTLHDRLADLAEDAPPGGPVPDLWNRAVRYRRVRRAGTVVIVAVAVLALAALGTLNRQRAEPNILPADAPGGMPDHIWKPSAWLPGTGRAGELGQLAALVYAERGAWTGSSTGRVGISATTGAYRFLDLPGLAGDAKLAPDGRHVAYWQAGTPSGSPNVDSEGRTVTAVAVYDTVTGEVRSHHVVTEHGLSPEELVWSDAQTLVFSFNQWSGGVGDSGMEQSSGRFDGWYRWDLDARAPTKLRMPGNLMSGPAWGGNGLLVVSADSAAFWIMDPRHPASARRVRIDGETSGGAPVVASGGSRIAAVWGGKNLRNPNRIVVADAGSGDTADPLRTDLIPGRLDTYAVLAWPDDRILAERAAPEGGLGFYDVVRVDPTTGDSSPVVEVDEMYPGAVQYATDLFAEPTVDGREPPVPLDPRTVAGAAATVVLGAILAVVLWRRRARP